MSSFFSNFFKNKTWPYVFLVLVPFLLYKKCLNFDFSPLDEQWMIEDNVWFLSKWSNLKSVFTGSTALMIYYRPFLVVSTMIDYHIGQLNPFIYHLTTLLWHLGCVVLLFEFLLQFKVPMRTAFFMALMFAVHPIMLHAAAWIPGRNDSMLCFFMLASLIYLNTYCKQKKLKHFILHGLFFVCAFLTKESAIIFPLIYFVLIYVRQKENKKLLFTSALVSLILLGVWAFLWKRFVSVQEFSESTFLATSKNLIAAYSLYFGKTLFPFQQSVTPVLKDAPILPSIITLLAVLFLWWRYKPEDKKAAYFGCLMYFVLLFLPILFIAMKQDGEHYEHRLYTPMIGVFLFLSQLNYRATANTSTYVYAGIIAALILVTNKRMDVYKDKFSFLDAAINSHPNSFFLYLRKGQILDQKGEYEKAIPAFDSAIVRSPGYGQAYLNRGNAYFSLGDKFHSLRDYSTALARSRPKLKEKILMQRCIAYNEFNEPDSAIKDLQVLKVCCQQMIKPSFEKELSIKYEIATWNKKVAQTPNNPEIYVMRGLFFMEQRMPKEALADFKKASELAPRNRIYSEYYLRTLALVAPSLK